MYLALYRKYRPQTFDEVIGQDHIIKTLQNQIKTDQIGHAYLFCGSRGTGKTSTAKIFARAINCKNPKNGSPCGECECCKLNANNIDILEIDAASNNGVDEIRDLREKVKYPPVNGKYKVYIIDEVHMLSVNAFNALLKTLEEPPSSVVFILATTEVHKLPATILSRCMRFDFRLVALDKLITHLEKICKENNIKYEISALNLIARAGEGSVRDTLSVADRCISFCGNNLTLSGVSEVLGVASKESLSEVCTNLLSGDIAKTLISTDAILSQGKSPLVLSRDLISYFIDLLYVETLKDEARKYIVISDELFVKMKSQATQENYEKIISAIELLSGVESELRYSVQPRVVLECALLKVISNQTVELRLKAVEQNWQNIIKNYENMQKNTQFLPNYSKQEDQNSQSLNNEKAINYSTVNNFENIDEPTNKSTIQHNLAEGQILGDLLQELRKEKALSLVAAIGQVKSVTVLGSVVELVFEDEITVDMISASKNKRLIDKFFEERGLTFKFVPMEKATVKGKDIADLSKLLGGKLKIDK